jgi:hypothetical protein
MPRQRANHARQSRIVRRGQGADLLETRGWDDLASGVIESSYSWSSSFLTAAIWRSSNSVKRRPRQRSAARMSAPNMSLSTGFSPKPLGMILSLRRSSTNSRSSRLVVLATRLVGERNLDVARRQTARVELHR